MHFTHHSSIALSLIPAALAVPRAIARIQVQVIRATAPCTYSTGGHAMVCTMPAAIPERSSTSMLIPAADATLAAHARHADALPEWRGAHRLAERVVQAGMLGCASIP